MGYTPRLTKPEAGNKYYIRKVSGGYSNAIQGRPTDKDCDVLANCVGYAYGRFNEIGQYGYCKYLAPVNAEDFMDYKGSCKTGMTPKVGAVMVWEGKGSLAGHVAIVEKVFDNNHVLTSESGYDSSAFWTQERWNTNGRWGCGTNYPFKGFIYNPAVPDEPVITPNVNRDETKDQIEVKITDLRVRNNAGLNAGILGLASKGYYNFYETKDADNYKWYRIADGQWVASDGEWLTELPKVEPKPITLKYKVGDVMIFNGKLYEKADGTGREGQTRSNYKCTITKTYDKPGTTKPYNINNGEGWVAEADLTPYVEPPKPTPTELKVGDTVKIVGFGYSNTYGTQGWTAGGLGWTRTILKIWRDSNGNLTAYPYQVGLGNSTTGFYKAGALQKK